MATTTLFDSRATGIFDLIDVYYLGTFLRAHQYGTSVYRQAWCDILGFSGNARRTYTDNYPPPYTVVRHADGCIVAFDGLQNLRQLLGYAMPGAMERLVGVTGYVMPLLRLVWLQIREDVFSRIAASPNYSKIVVTGYSFGGALAAVATQAIKNRYPLSSLQWACSFGSPKPGDQEFCDNVTAPFICIENEGDDCVHFPWLNSTNRPGLPILNYFAVPDHPGRALTLTPDGTYQFGRPGVLTRNRIDNMVTTFVANAIAGDPTGHELQEYVRRLGVALFVQTKLPTFARMKSLNDAMDANVDPGDFTTPETPPATVALAVPPLPAFADLQRVSSGDGDPAGPTVTYDTRLVGARVGARTQAIVSRSRTANDAGDYHGLDKRLIHNTWKALDQLNKRDALLLSGKKTLKLRNTLAKKILVNAKIHMLRVQRRDLRAADNPTPTRELSTRKLIIDVNDVTLTAAFAAVLLAIDAAFLVLTPHLFLIDRSVGSAIADQLEELILHLQYLENFSEDFDE